MSLLIQKLLGMTKGSADPLTSAFGFVASWVLLADEPYELVKVWLCAQDPLKLAVAGILVIVCLRAFKKKTIALLEEVVEDAQ